MRIKAVLKGKAIVTIVTGIITWIICLIIAANLGYKSHIHSQDTKTIQLQTELDRYLLKIKEIAKRISQSRHIRKRLISNPYLSDKEEDNRDILATLESIAVGTDADIVYVMNPHGLVIASTFYDRNKSLTGYRYTFRPYFTGAMEGNAIMYPAVGVTTLKRGIYFSSPVYGPQGGKPIGATVIKMGLNRLDHFLKYTPLPAAIMSPEGIIFASNQNQWLFKNALPLPDAIRTQIQAAKQFGELKIASLPFRFDSKKIKKDGNTFSVIKTPIAIPQWKVVTLKNTGGTFPTFYGIAVTFCVILLTFLILQNLFDQEKKNELETQKRKAEDKFQDQSEFLRVVLDSLSYPFYIVDLADYSIILANKAAKSGKYYDLITCHELTYSLDKPCPAAQSEFQCPADLIKETLKPVIMEQDRILEDGSKKHVEIHAYPIFDNNGNLTRMIKYVLDISQRKNMEEELLKTRQLESIGILAGGIAHDFNNFLSVIIGNIALVKEDMDPGTPGYNFLSHAEDSAVKAADLAQKLTTFSKGGWLEKETIHVPFFIKQFIETTPFDLGFEIKFTIDIARDIDTITADRSRLKQVLYNLVRNAAEACGNNREGYQVKIEAKNIVLPAFEIPGFENLSSQKDSKFIRISVIDKGKGIQPEHLSKIFNPYFSTKNATDQKGMGLGLSLCYSIIKKHNGYITVRSEPGKGTTVDLYLPTSVSTAI